jgi:hypothetical protein
MKSNGMADRVSDLGSRARERIVHSRMEKLDRENERLRTEVTILRDDLDEERGSLKDALKGLEAHQPAVREDRKPHVLRTLLIAGGAYVLGTRAGRERYEQIAQKARSLSSDIRRRVTERDDPGWETSGSEGAAKAPRASSSS